MSTRVDFVMLWHAVKTTPVDSVQSNDEAGTE